MILDRQTISKASAPRLLRALGIGLLALAFVALLPVAPAQQPRDLGTLRSAPATPAASGFTAAPAIRPGDLPYRPFIDPAPLPVHTRWYLLLLPMAFGIAVVYKAVMLQTIDRYWQQVVYLTVQIIVGMILLAVASYLLVMLYIPAMSSG